MVLKKTHKTAIFLAITILVNVFLWYFAKATFFNFNLTYLALFIVISTIYFTLLSLLFWLGKNSNYIIYAIIISNLSFFLFFTFSIYYLLAFIIFAIGIYLGKAYINRDTENRASIAIDEFLYSGTKIMVSVFFLLISVIFYFTLQDEFSFRQFPKSLQLQATEFILPGFTEDTTVDDTVLLVLARSRGISDQKEAQDFVEKSKKSISKQELNILRESFLSQIGVANNFTGNEKITQTDILEKLFNDRIRNYYQNVKPLLNISLSVIFFFLLSTIIKQIYALLIIAEGYLLFLILKKYKIVKIHHKQVQSEEALF